MILADGMMGQVMEPVVFRKPRARDYPESRMLSGAGDGKSKFYRSLILDAVEMEGHNWKLARKYRAISEAETRADTFCADGAEMIVVAYGTAARVAKGAIKRLGAAGHKAGLFRPVSLWPFPARELKELAVSVKKFLVFEMSMGQMLEDVRLAIQGEAEIDFYGRPGGAVVTPAELANVIERRMPGKDTRTAGKRGWRVAEGGLGQ
jgi:2-oxoglutarate ferredoxin oxidoreductase subunit alpha